MKIELAKEIGYCPGVKNAIKEAIQIKKNYPENDVYLYGELVHNDQTIKQLEENGLILIADKKEELESINSDAIIIFSAHGHRKEDEELLKNKGIKFFDLTCPIIKNITSQIIKALSSDHKIAYIGKPNHKEARAILSLSPNIIFINYEDSSANINLDLNDTIIFSQSSLSEERVNDIVANIKSTYKNVTYKSTLCPHIINRQREMANISEHFDIALILGDIKSSNAYELYKTASNNKNIKRVLQGPYSYLETYLDEFDNVDSIFISSATSANDDDVYKLVDRLKSIYSR